MAKIISANPVWQNGISIVRILTGWFIFRYSWEIFHIQELLRFLEEAKMPFPVISGYAAKGVEFIGGICLMLGLFTRWITIPLIAVMIGVIVLTAHGNIYEGELCFLYILLFAIFFFEGPGKWSLDHWLGRKFEARSFQSIGLKQPG